MTLQGCRKADRAEIVERDRFATPKPLKSHGERNLLSRFLCHNAKVVHAFKANTPFEKLPGTQITYPGKISIAPAAPSVPHFPRFRALALFGRRPQERVDSVVIPASKNLHRKRLTQRNIGRLIGRHPEHQTLPKRFVRVVCRQVSRWRPRVTTL
jgi:hypothetical protein